jgi:hypothetical protein
MILHTRPSVVHWAAVFLIVASISMIAWVPILGVIAEFYPPHQRLIASLVATTIVPVLLLPKMRQSARGARWTVDLEGLESPAIGRISFSEVVSIIPGYPRAESIGMTTFQTVLAPGSRSSINSTLVLRLSDGRLLPLNLWSPSIVGGRDVMAKVAELLAGKLHPNTSYTASEIAALRRRPMNRLVEPQKSQKA